MRLTPWVWSPGPTAIDEHFELWATRVEQLVGRPIDRKKARIAFECYEAPTKALTPEEYARELTSGKPFDVWGGTIAWQHPGEPDSRVVRVPNTETVAALEELERGGGKTYRGTTREIIKTMTRASREPPRIWKPDATAQRLLNWIYWLFAR